MNPQSALAHRGKRVVAAVQVFFQRDGGRRDYLIWHHSAAGGPAPQEDRWGAYSLAGLVKTDGIDLRKREHARKLEAVLSGLDWGELTRRGGCNRGRARAGGKPRK
jgi:hypothetical protein